MKKILLITTMFILGLLATELFAQSVLIVPYRIQVPAPIVVVPPQTQLVPPPIPPKPNFQTPIRDGLWYGGVYLNQSLWYNRYWRHQRLERLLGPQVVITPNN